METEIFIEQRTAVAEDGYNIPVRIYRKNQAEQNKPILYYIHGGGFFAGSPDVVEESVKMLVDKTGICAVSVDYRIAPENPYPTGHNDCFAALKWVAKNNPPTFLTVGEHDFLKIETLGYGVKLHNA